MMSRRRWRMGNVAIDENARNRFGQIVNDLGNGSAVVEQLAATETVSQIRRKGQPGRERKGQHTYTDKDVPITIRASTFSRSASSLVLTESCKASPKNVTPGLRTPPQTLDGMLLLLLLLLLLLSGSRARFLRADVRVPVRVGVVVLLLFWCRRRHRATRPARMSSSKSAELTLRRHVSHVANFNDPCT